MPSFVLPEVDMLTVSRSSRNQRKYIRDFIPKIGLSVVNYKKIDHIENFYIECQDFRDYYRDPYAKLNRPVPFKLYYGKCGIKLDTNTSTLLKPVRWVEEPYPVFFPVERKGDPAMYGPPDFRGNFDRFPCTKFKR